MKRLSFLLELIIFSNTFIYAQNWEMQHPYTVSGARDIFFINDSIGWSVGEAGELFKSTDGGLNWLKKNIDSKPSLYSVFFIDDKKGWISGHEGLFKTIDGGENWSKTIETSNLNNVYFFNKDTGVVSSSNSIYYTYNGGDSFIREIVVITEKDNYIKDISFPNQKYGWLAVLSNHPEHGKVYHTVDSGKTWDVQKSFTDDWVTSVSFTDTLNGWITLSTPMPGKYKRKIYHTSDGGKTWLPQPNDYELDKFCDLEDICMIDTLNGWAVGGCSYYTKNGGQTWDEQNIPFSYSINSVQFISIDKGWAASTDKLSFSTDTGKTWNTYPYKENINSVFFINDLYGYAVGENGYILKTVDGGKYWKYIKLFDNTIKLNKVLVTKNNKILISAINTSTYEGILYISTDSAKSFSVLKKFKEPISSIEEVGINLYSLSDSLYQINIDNYQIVSKKLPVEAQFTDMFFIGKDTIWLTGYTGSPWSSNPEDRVNSFIYSSVDKGDNWIKSNYEIGTSVINKIYFIDENKGFIVGEGYLVKTINGGETWAREDFNNSNLYNICFLSRDNGIIISSEGIYRTVNGGESWESVDIQNPYSILNMHFVNDSLGWIVGREGFIFKTETFFGVEYLESITNNNNYEINIFPNPATSKINVNFKSINDVFYKLINIDGILCKNGYLGTRDNIDVSDLNTGIYILELYSGKTVIARGKIVKR